MTCPRLIPIRAIALGAAAVLAVAGCAAGTKTVTKTVTATVTAPPAAATAVTAAAEPTAAATASGAPKQVGNDVQSAVCKSLSLAEVQAATGLAVVTIKAIRNPGLPRVRDCDWQLSPAPDCPCTYVSLTVNRALAQTLSLYEKQFGQDIAAGKAKAITGLAHSELTGGIGEAGSATFVQNNLLLTLSVRLHYLWNKSDSVALLQLAPLVAARAHTLPGP